MPSITFDLETVTPLFLSGANQQEAELRPPAFRGALRYWFRAIAGSITTFDQVKNWENNIFGSTDAGSSVIIRVQAEKPTSLESLKKYNGSARDNPFSGFEYLFFSIYGSGSREARAYIPPKQKFRVILQVRPLVKDNLKCLKLAAGSMWCLINLGGIGSRSNRGGGSLKINNSEYQDVSIDPIEFVLDSTTLSDVSTEIGIRLQKVKNLFQSILNPVSTIPIVPTEFDIISSITSNLYLWHSGQSNIDSRYEKLLNEFGKAYQKFRVRYGISTGDDYIQVKKWIETEGKSNINTVKRAAFGLPIQFYYTSLKLKPHNRALLEASQDITRIASPFHVKVIALVNGQFAILLIHFKTQLLPTNTNSGLVLRNKSFRRSVEILAPNQDIIEEFINALGNLPRVTLP
jgi:CRISPR-associated protein Cmr1